MEETLSLTKEENEIFERLLLSETGDVSQYRRFNFRDPIELAYNICYPISSGQQSFHKWQAEALVFLSKRGIWTKNSFLEFFLAACNGSGKDAYIIALLAVFYSLDIIRHRTIISTSSYNQLSKQTSPYIVGLCRSCNKLFPELGLCSKDEQPFIIKKDHIVSPITGSEIVMFVTDDPGRAEGWHPFPDCPTQELAIILNELKSFDPLIIEHFQKGTYNRWIGVSSTGRAQGYFYGEYKSALKWEDYIQLDKEQKKSIRKIARKVIAYDCSHIAKEKVERDIEEKGRNSRAVRTKYFSEFVSEEGLSALDRDEIDSCIAQWKSPSFKPPLVQIDRRAGFDIGAGRCKSVITVIENNKLLAQHSYTERDTTKTVLWAMSIFSKYNLRAKNIFGDDNGIGQPVIDQLYKRGWNINRVRNQSPASDKSTYGNLGAELYFNAGEIIKRKLIDLTNLERDEEFKDQLGGRPVEFRGTFDKIYCVSKADLLAKQIPSPDKADSFVLALAGLTWKDFKPGDITIKPQGTRNSSSLEEALPTIDTLAKEMLKSRKNINDPVFVPNFRESWIEQLKQGYKKPSLQTTQTLTNFYHAVSTRRK